MRIDHLHLAAIGVHLPDRISGAKAVELGLYDEDDLLDSGLDGALVAGDMPAVDLAVSAATEALKRAGLAPAAVDLLVHSSVFRQGPQMWAPSGYILRELGCPGTPALEIRQGCNGLIRAMEVAAGQFALDPRRSGALLTAADNFTASEFDRWRGGGPGYVVGDGAAAVVLDRDSGFAQVRSISTATVPELEAMHRGQEPLHTADGGRRIDMTTRALSFLHADGAVPGLEQKAVQVQLEVVVQALEEAEVSARDLAKVLFTHCAGYMVDQWLMRPLGLPLSRSSWSFGRTVGHLGASDHIVALNHLLEQGQLAPGDHVLMAGGAPGYSASALVLTINRLPAWAGPARAERNSDV